MNNPIVLSLMTFGAVVMAVVGIYSVMSDLYLRDRSRIAKRVDDEMRKRQRDQARKSPLFKDLSTGGVALAADTDEVDVTMKERFETMITQSGLNLTPQKLLIIMAGAGLGVAVVVYFINPSFIVSGLLAAVAASVPFLYVQHKRRSRLDKMLSQLPDAFGLMSRCVRAGQTVSQSLLAVADEFEPPIATEFSYCYEQQNLGLSSEDSMRDLARRNGLVEIKIFVLAMLVQQQTGGNLAELLDNLATVVRERFRLRAKVRTLTAEGRFQAVVLLALPPFMLMLILLLNRTYGQVLLDNPNILVAMLILEFVGALWIRKIVSVDV